MANPIIGTVGLEIILEAPVDVSDAVTARIEALKPDGSRVTWTASVTGQTIRYTTQADDLDIAGDWLLEPWLDRTTWTGYLAPATMTVDARPAT
jgi:hypothetical protein